MNTASLGSVSTATMREEDLIPSFLDELRRLDPDNETGYQEIESRFYSIPEDEQDDYFGSEEASYDLCELFDALDKCAPEYVYFGANYGDGSDYGFWVDWESIEDDISYEQSILHVNKLESVEDTYEGFVLAGEGFGTDCALYDCDGKGEKLLVWEI